MPETVTIDGRGITVQEAIMEMRSRMQPLEQRGFHPISEVEIVDTSKKEIVQTFRLTDQQFQIHLKPDQQQQKSQQTADRLDQRPHAPERKEHYPYIARIRLEA